MSIWRCEAWIRASASGFPTAMAPWIGQFLPQREIRQTRRRFILVKRNLRPALAFPVFPRHPRRGSRPMGSASPSRRKGKGHRPRQMAGRSPLSLVRDRVGSQRHPQRRFPTPQHIHREAFRHQPLVGSPLRQFLPWDKWESGFNRHRNCVVFRQDRFFVEQESGVMSPAKCEAGLLYQSYSDRDQQKGMDTDV